MVKKLIQNLKNNNYEPLVHVFVISLVILFIINFLFMFSLTSTLNNKYDEAVEAARPALIQLTIIDNKCKDCIPLNPVISLIKSSNVNITSEKTLSLTEASSLITKYNIDKLPAVIVTGELNKTSLSMLTAYDNALVFRNNFVPYFDINKNKVVGLVSAKVISLDSCTKCFDPNLLIKELKNSVAITEVTKLNQESAKDIISLYNITMIPTLILSGDVSSYSEIVKAWENIGDVVNDNFILRKISPPYKNISSDKIIGLVSVTYLKDSSCLTCYDVTQHQQILNRFGVAINDEKTFDISSQEGKDLISKYSITKVPTIIISNDVSVYTSFMNNIFTKVTTKQSDDNYLFTSVELLGSYKDLNTNKVVTPTPTKA